MIWVDLSFHNFMFFNAWFSGTGKTHVAAAVALAASKNLPQKETTDTVLQSIMMNHDKYHDISWLLLRLEVSVHEQAHEREILEFTNIWTTCVVLALHPSLFCYFLESRNASCVSRNPMQRQSTCTNDWRWISTGRLVFQRDIWLDMTHMSYLIHLFFLNTWRIHRFGWVWLNPNKHSKP